VAKKADPAAAPFVPTGNKSKPNAAGITAQRADVAHKAKKPR
jgi:hypothetical protein